MKQDHILYAMLLSLWLCFLINKLKKLKKKCIYENQVHSCTKENAQTSLNWFKMVFASLRDMFQPG